LTIDDTMSDLFTVDSNGVFNVMTSSLLANNSRCVDNKFVVPVKATNLKGDIFTTTIVVQLSKLATKHQCPQISNTAMCQFSINQSDFDSSF
jgi:hypothetical protein